MTICMPSGWTRLIVVLLFFGKGTEPINPINWIGNRLREKLNCHFEHKKKLMRFDRDDQAVMIVIKFDAFSLRLRTSEW